MNPFKEFNHFIAYFVPGVVLFVVLLMVSSLLLGTNVLISNNLFSTGIFITLICGTILGLFIDDVRHSFIEPKLEKSILKELKYDQNKIEDLISYIPEGLNIEVYKLIRDEYFYFYEFDVNISMALLILSIVIPFYIVYIYFLPCLFGLVLFLILFFVARLFYKMGKEGYSYFWETFIATMSKIKSNFKNEIKLNK